MAQQSGSDLNRRVDAMYHRDQLMAWILVAALWLSVLFVYLAVQSLLPTGQIRVALIVSGAMVLAFNTAAILAMVNHYKHDKTYIYSLDIRHLDQNRAARGK